MKIKVLLLILGVLLILIALLVEVKSLSVSPTSIQVFLPANSNGLTYLTVYNTTNQTIFTLQPQSSGNVTMLFTNQTLNNDSIITLNITVGNYSTNTNITTPFVFEASNGGTPVYSLVNVFIEAQPPLIGDLTLDNPYCGLNKNITIPFYEQGLLNPNTIQFNLDGNYYTPTIINNTVNFITPYQPLCGNHTASLTLSDQPSSNINLQYGSPNTANATWNFTLTPEPTPNFTVNTYPLITSTSYLNLTGWYDNTIPTLFLNVNNNQAVLNNSFWNAIINLNQGLNTINITAGNQAGNTTQSINITLDQTPPSITTTITNNNIDTANYTYSVTDTQPIQSIFYSLDKNPPTQLYSNANTIQLNTLNLTPGVHTITLNATDNLNNTNSNTITLTSSTGMTTPVITNINNTFQYQFTLKGTSYYTLNVSGLPATPSIQSPYYNGVFNNTVKIYAGSLTNNTVQVNFNLTFNFPLNANSGNYTYNWAITPTWK